MPDIAINIVNLPQVESAFAQAPEIMRLNLSRAIPLALRAVKDDEEAQYADLGIGVRSGNLLRSIRTGVFYVPGSLRGEVGPNTTNSPGYDILDKPWHGVSHYSIFVHEGTKFMQSKPFLRNAVKSAQTAVDKLFKDAVQSTLNIIAEKTKIL